MYIYQILALTTTQIFAQGIFIDQSAVNSLNSGNKPSVTVTVFNANPTDEVDLDDFASFNQIKKSLADIVQIPNDKKILEMARTALQKDTGTANTRQEVLNTPDKAPMPIATLNISIANTPSEDRRITLRQLKTLFPIDNMYKTLPNEFRDSKDKATIKFRMLVKQKRQALSTYLQALSILKAATSDNEMRDKVTALQTEFQESIKKIYIMHTILLKFSSGTKPKEFREWRDSILENKPLATWNTSSLMATLD